VGGGAAAARRSRPAGGSALRQPEAARGVPHAGRRDRPEPDARARARRRRGAAWGAPPARDRRVRGAGHPSHPEHAATTDRERRAPPRALRVLNVDPRAIVYRELIGAIELPRVEGRQWFRKVGTRAAQSISKLVIAAVRAPSPRVAIGSVAATTVRLRRTEAALAAGAGIEEAANVLEAEITPIDDIRSSADYRRQVAANLLRRFWSDTAL
jgi:hypothetical protein